MIGSDNGETKDERGALSNIVNSSKITQMATQHIKKHSAEFNQHI